MVKDSFGAGAHNCLTTHHGRDEPVVVTCRIPECGYREEAASFTEAMRLDSQHDPRCEATQGSLKCDRPSYHPGQHSVVTRWE